MQTAKPPRATRLATAAPIASPAPTSKATLSACVMFLSPEPIISLAGNPDGAIGDHSLDFTVAVSKLPQHLFRMLPHPRGRSGYDGLVDFEASRRFGVPDPTDRRLVEFGDDVPRDDLFVMDDLAAPQDRRARDVRRVETLQPFGRRVLHDVFGHLIDAGRGVHRARSRRGKARILDEFRIAGRVAEAVPSESEIVPAVMY